VPREAPAQPSGSQEPAALEDSEGSPGSIRPDIVLPPPLPGYEEAVAKLSEQQANENPFAFAALSSGVDPSDPQPSPQTASALPESQSAEQLLRSHRGFQLKELELELVEAAEKRKTKAARLEVAKTEA
jgi:hypothetical protein